jgi:hypothetical protein
MRHFDDCLRSLLIACALAAALAIPSAVRAAGNSPVDATAEQKKEATAHFTAGKQALEAMDYDLAAAELRASLAIVDSPNAHLELARALRDSGKLGDSWIEFGRAAETATRLAPKEDRYLKTADAAAGERRDIEGKLALVAITVAHAPADATVTVGGRLIPPEDWNAPMVVPLGAIDVVLADGGGAELARRTVNTSLGQTTPVSLDGSSAAASHAKVDRADDSDKSAADEGQPAQLPEPIAPQPIRSKLRPFAYVAAGVGVAGLATFTVVGLMANSTYDDLKSACPHGCPPDKRSEIDKGIMQQTVANVGLGVGLVGLAAGATMFFLSMPAPAPGNGTALVVAPLHQGAYLGLRGFL